MTNISRRSLLHAGGALVVSFAAPLPALAQGKSAALPAPDQLDSWLAIHQDGSVVAFFGKPDVGQGVDVAIRQIVAEELDVAVGRVSLVMSDTAVTVNQGGASGSTGIERGGVTIALRRRRGAARFYSRWRHRASACRSRHCVLMTA